MDLFGGNCHKFLPENKVNTSLFGAQDALVGSGATMASEKGWLDHLGALLLPVVVSVGGLAYTIHKDAVDREVRAEERAADLSRQEWDRDTAYLQLLTSSNPDEKKLGLAITNQLVKSKKFPDELQPVLHVIAGGLPSDESTAIATEILATAQPTDRTAKARAAAVAKSAALRVFMQIQSEDQRSQAQDLLDMFKQQGYDPQPIKKVDVGPNQTDIRYFSSHSLDDAKGVAKLLRDRGMTVAEPKYYQSLVPFKDVEIWLGKSAAPKAKARPAPAESS